MSKKTLFIERRPEQGDYAIRKPNSQRASDILPTQREAIARVLEIESSILVERVRNTENGKPGQWRKP